MYRAGPECPYAEYATVTRLRLFVEFIAGDKVHGEMNLDFVLFRLFHQLFDDLGAISVEQRAANLCNEVILMNRCRENELTPTVYTLQSYNLHPRKCCKRLIFVKYFFY